MLRFHETRKASGFPDFEYDILPRGKYIRILHLQPGKISEPIFCEIHTVELSKVPNFEAISYVWGDARNTENINCSGKTLSIPSSLSKVFEYFRLEDSSRVLWADAICINQYNDVERANQVKLMGEVFSSAQNVLVWLGEDLNLDARFAFNLIQEVNQHFNAEYESYKQDRHQKGIPGNQFGSFFPQDPTYSNPFFDVSNISWKATKDIFARKWFTRVWVLQEVGLAKSAVAYIGRASIRFSEIVQFAFMDAFQLHYLFGFNGCPEVNNSFQTVWSSYRNDQNWIQEVPLLSDASEFYTHQTIPYNIVDIFYTATMFKASENRDLVFALLGHPHATVDDDNTLIKWINYEVDIYSVYKNVTIQCCKLTNSLDVLSCITRSSEDSLNGTSWVVPWHLNMRQIMRIQTVGLFDCALQNQTKNLYALEIKEDSMTVLGIIFDTVSSSTSRLLSEQFRHVTSDAPGFKLINPVESCFNLSWDDPNCNLRLTTFLETLVAGQYMLNGTIQEDFEAYLHQYCSKSMREAFGFDSSQSNKDTSSSSENFWESAQRACHQRKFFTTGQGRMGIGPLILKPGDVCVVLVGTPVPFILRETSTKGIYKLVGECFIIRVMHGEIVMSMQEEQRSWEKITIV